MSNWIYSFSDNLTRTWAFVLKALALATSIVIIKSVLQNIALLIGINETPIFDSAFETIAAVVSIFIFWLYWEKRPVAELGINPSWIAITEIILGFSFILISSIPFILFFPILKPTGPYTTSLFTIQISMGLLTGLREELLFRRVAYSLLSGDKKVSIFALIVSNVFFALIHGREIGEFLVLFTLGIFGTACYLMTNRLWVSIGYHAAWNAIVASMFLDYSTHLIAYLLILQSFILLFLYSKLLQRKTNNQSVNKISTLYF